MAIADVIDAETGEVILEAERQCLRHAPRPSTTVCWTLAPKHDRGGFLPAARRRRRRDQRYAASKDHGQDPGGGVASRSTASLRPGDPPTLESAPRPLSARHVLQRAASTTSPGSDASSSTPSSTTRSTRRRSTSARSRRMTFSRRSATCCACAAIWARSTTSTTSGTGACARSASCWRTSSGSAS